MRKYPQFLKVHPLFHGLTFIDIGAFVGSLYLGQFLRLPSMPAVCLALGSIALSKYLSKNIDLVGLLRPRKSVISLKEMYKEKE